jgi:hypothetical protein
MDPMRGRDEERLDGIFEAYRRACPTPDVSANFMPNLWSRIEARQRTTFSFRRMAQAFVTTAVALSIALGVYMAMPRPNASAYSYVEALAEANSSDSSDLAVATRYEVPESDR